jgi:hypothetical protein
MIYMVDLLTPKHIRCAATALDLFLPKLNFRTLVTNSASNTFGRKLPAQENSKSGISVPLSNFSSLFSYAGRLPLPQINNIYELPSWSLRANKPMVVCSQHVLPGEITALHHGPGCDDAVYHTLPISNNMPLASSCLLLAGSRKPE